MDLAAKIKKLRDAHQWTQAQLATAAKVSQQLIDKIERGKVRETRKLPQIAAAFNLKVEELLSGVAPQVHAQSIQLTDEEQRILDAYRSASRTGKQAIMGAVMGVSTSVEHTADKAPKRTRHIVEDQPLKATKKSNRRLLR